MSSEDLSDSENTDKKVKKICCKDCGKKFSYHQGLYTHRKSGVCKKTRTNMINTIDYLEKLKINMDELIICDDINLVFKYVFKANDYNTLPFIIHDKKKKCIRILVDNEKYVNDKDYVYLVSFLNNIRYKIIKLINKSKLANDSEDSCTNELTFLNVMLKDFDVKLVLKHLLNATCE
jgi:hypothetical protein